MSTIYINEARKFCTEWLAAWTGNKPSSLIEFYSKDCFYSDPANPDGLNGHSEILPYFIKLLAANPDWEWKMNEIYPTTKGFILKWDSSIPVNNKLIRTSGMDIVEVSRNKITRNEVYFDRTKWLKALSS